MNATGSAVNRTSIRLDREYSSPQWFTWSNNSYLFIIDANRVHYWLTIIIFQRVFRIFISYIVEWWLCRGLQSEFVHPRNNRKKVFCDIQIRIKSCINHRIDRHRRRIIIHQSSLVLKTTDTIPVIRFGLFRISCRLMLIFEGFLMKWFVSPTLGWTGVR